MSTLQGQTHHTKHKFWTDSTSRRFELLSVWSPKQDDEVWVEYRNTTTGDTYTALQAAFMARFTPQSD